MEATPNVLPAGHCLHRYQIESVLGSGGFGITYKAVHETLPLAYAIKEYFPAEWAQRGHDCITVQANSYGQRSMGADQSCYDWGRERFLTEAQTLVMIDHPHVVRVRDYFSAHGTAYLVMDYEEGETLQSLLRREHTLTESRIQRLLNEILIALEAVHEKHFLHRDIKPDNLYLRTRDGSVMLIDFGAARQALTPYTRAITSVFTPGYSPPEQYIVDGQDGYGAWTDLYAVGAVMYHCIAGKKPIEAANRMMGGQFKSALEVGADRYSAVLLKAVDQALELQPNKRFQSASQMRDALISAEEIVLPEKVLPGEVSPEKTVVQATARTGQKQHQPENIPSEKVVPQMLSIAEEAQKKSEEKTQEEIVPKTPSNRAKKGIVFGILILMSVVYGLWFNYSILPVPEELPVSEMVLIDKGCFQMGSPPSEKGRDSDEKQHQVCVEAFEIGRYEVTFAEYDRFCEATGRKKPDDESWGRGKRPVINVNWYDAVAYAEWLSKETGKKYRLPTEAEWEYAARAGTATAFWWGNAITSAQANYDGRYVYAGGGKKGVYRGKTVPVGSFDPNPWTLYDMAGNVWEWTCSEYDENYGGNEKGCTSNNSAIDSRALRGGAWYNLPAWVRSANRVRDTPDARDLDAGFRLSRSL